MTNNHFLVANEMVFQQNSDHNELYCRLIEETQNCCEFNDSSTLCVLYRCCSVKLPHPLC